MSHTKPIDLGRSLGGELVAALSPGQKHYPDLHIGDCEDERLLDMPDEGTAEIHYKIVRRHHTEENGRNGEKKKRRTCSITMEIRSIEPGHDPKFDRKKKTHWEMFNT
jgi:hypothetical protein